MEPSPNRPLVSIITPVYRQSKYLAEAVNSVLKQDHHHWEMLVVSDGPDPETDAVMARFADARIRYFAEKPHGGVSHTRNYALDRSKGDFWVFLDADDALPGGCLSERLRCFERDALLRVVDGTVVLKDANLERELERRSPTFKGHPLARYLALDSAVFIGVSAMVRREPNAVLHFDEALTHNEDLLFYMTVFQQWGGTYGYVDSDVLFYRRGHASAMGDLTRLEQGYRAFYEKVGRNFPEASAVQLAFLKRKIRSILFKSYLKRGHLVSAMRLLVAG
jgi:glycosyltransferase involved in cell wall biosynthesis